MDKISFIDALQIRNKPLKASDIGYLLLTIPSCILTTPQILRVCKMQLSQWTMGAVYEDAKYGKALWRGDTFSDTIKGQHTPTVHDARP